MNFDYSFHSWSISPSIHIQNNPQAQIVTGRWNPDFCLIRSQVLSVCCFCRCSSFRPPTVFLFSCHHRRLSTSQLRWFGFHRPPSSTVVGNFASSCNCDVIMLVFPTLVSSTSCFFLVGLLCFYLSLFHFNLLRVNECTFHLVDFYHCFCVVCFSCKRLAII